MKENYQIILDKTLKSLKERKKLLLHSCCGPCSSYVLNYLTNYFDITVYYYNPNIHPKKEYLKRMNEQKRLIKELNNPGITFLNANYNSNDYFKRVKGFEELEEGSIRCHICFHLRMEKAAKYALANNFDYFATTLSVSPYKNSMVLNDIGLQLEEDLNIKYLQADFKKKEGYKKSIMLSKEYSLYRQEYCGCIYSLNKEKKF